MKRLTVATRRDVVREAKERFCKVATEKVRRIDEGQMSLHLLCTVTVTAVSYNLSLSFSIRVCAQSYAPGMFKDLEEEVLRLPDGNIVVVGEEAYSAPGTTHTGCPQNCHIQGVPQLLTPRRYLPEILFSGSRNSKGVVFNGIDNCGSGLHNLVYESVMRCEEKLRQRLLTNIMLTGGNSLIPGLDIRSIESKTIEGN